MPIKRALLALSLAFPATASAENGWDFTATAYGWFPGLTGAVDTPMGEVEANVDFGDILDSLDIAFLGAIEARKNRLTLIADLQYFDLGTDIDAPTGALFSGGEADSQTVLLNSYLAYALVDTDNLRFDVGGGLRYTYTQLDTTLFGQGDSPDASFSIDGDFVDLLIAARLSGNFTDRVYGVAFADVGGFGIEGSSDLTWQIAGALGYRFNETWSLTSGYRHLSIEREFGPTDAEIVVSGPFLGVQASF